MRCSDETGSAGPGSGLTVLGTCSLIGGVPAGLAVGRGFFDGAGRRGAFFATFLGMVLFFLTVLPRVALLAGLLRFARLVAILAPLLRVCSGIAAVQDPATAHLSVIAERYWITRCSVWNGGKSGGFS